MLYIYLRTITFGVCKILSCYRQNDAKVWNQKWCPTLYFFSHCTFIIMFPFKYLSICLIGKFIIFSMLQIKFLILKMYITLYPPPNPQKRKGKMYVQYNKYWHNTVLHIYPLNRSKSPAWHSIISPQNSNYDILPCPLSSSLIYGSGCWE